MSLKNLPQWAWAAAALAVGLVVGIAIGNSSQPDEADATADAGPQRATARPDRDGRPGGDDADGAPRGVYSSGSSAAEYAMTVLDSPSRLGRMQRLLAFLDQLPDGQFADVYRELSDSPLARDRQSELSLILQSWAERDPYAATAHLQENGAEDWERETTLSTWAAYDPQGAFAWASAAEDEGRINNWVVGALSGIASSNPELAREYLVGLESEHTQRESLRSIEAAILRNGFAATEAWIAGLDPESEVHSRAARYFADDLANLDPAEAGRWSESLTDAGTRREVSERVSEEWAEIDLDSARAWVETLPQDTMSEAAEGIIEEWAGRDPAEASQWLASLGNSPELDGARREFVRETWRQNPEAALGVSATVADAEDRNRVMSWTLGRWAREDQQAAADWVNANPTAVPAETIQRVFGQE